MYKNSMIHVYYLNDRDKEEADRGFSFFVKKENTTKYQKMTDIAMGKLKKISNEYKNLNIKKLNNKDLEKRFNDILQFLAFYSDLYILTEAAAMAKFEIEYKRHEKLIEKFGKIRFVLHEKSKALWYVLGAKLMSEMSKRWGLGFSDLFFYTSKEIKDLFRNKKVDAKVINLRKKGFAFIPSPDKKMLLVGDDFKKLFKEIIENKGVTDKKIKGLVVMKGVIKARAEVILHNKRSIAKKLKLFKKGNILVTDMTSPDDATLVSKKAGGIITDEGGITSHAAIIAREFKIPCVVGTKIATQIIKTGDLVEINGDTGVVTILK
ncbi:MAG: PEP-utilizing enzyme [Candidatus Falkowbacteria bacterium]